MPEPDSPDRRVTLVSLALLAGAASYLFAAGGLQSEYAGVASLLLIPAALGALVGNLSDPEGRGSLANLLLWPPLLILGLTGVGWLFFNEGAICIAMVLPLWLPAAVGGALANRWNARRTRRARERDLLSVGWVVLPLSILLIERGQPPAWQERLVTRQAVVSATPEQLWPAVLSIPTIAATEGRATLTHDALGVPRPREAMLVRRGGRLVRSARWGSELRFDEIVTRIEPHSTLAWRFAFGDDSVQRYTDRHIAPDGPMLKILGGSYRLQPLAGGRSLLTLETRYRMRSPLAPYLAWWGERLLGDVQDNILAIVEQRAESSAHPA